MTAAAWEFAVAIFGIAGGLFAGVALFLRFTDTGDQIERYIAADPSYREERARALDGAGWAHAYRDRLAASLAWLDRRFGPAHKAKAFGICVVVALCHAWVAFFLGYALSGKAFVGASHLADPPLVTRLALSAIFCCAAFHPLRSGPCQLPSGWCWPASCGPTRRWRTSRPGSRG